jgi:hypothetical protein
MSLGKFDQHTADDILSVGSQGEVSETEKFAVWAVRAVCDA